jgi:hypothetical protein
MFDWSFVKNLFIISDGESVLFDDKILFDTAGICAYDIPKLEDKENITAIIIARIL